MTSEVGQISVYVSGSDASPATIDTAARVADSFSASLLGVHVVDDVSVGAVAPVSGTAMNPVVIEDFEHQAKKRAQVAKDQFESAMKKVGRDGRWLCIDDPKYSTREQVVRALHLADFIVMEQGDPEHPETGSIGRLQDAIVDSGRPVIVHPHRWSGGIGDTAALVAWKPTREAARAVHDAVPFLSQAERVTVTTVSDRDMPPPDAKDPGKPLVDYLVARGIKAESQPLHGIDHSNTGDALMDQAARVGATVLVMGAYSHSRLREGLFGGVTRDVLERTKIPTLMAH